MILLRRLGTNVKSLPYFVKVVGLPENGWQDILTTVLKPLTPKVYEREAYIALALDSEEAAEKTVDLLNGHKQENLTLRAVALVPEGLEDWRHEIFDIRPDFKVDLDEDEIDTEVLERELEAKFPEPKEVEDTITDTNPVSSTSQDPVPSTKK